MARNVDLDAMRAARAEVERDPVTLTFGGKTFNLPDTLPIAFAVALERDSTTEALAALLGEQMDDFLALGPDYRDLTDLLTAVVPEYTGRSLGESAASSTSSKSGGKRSRRTLPGSTASTSPEPASDPTP